MIKGAAKIPIAVIISSAKERVPRVLSIRFFVSFLSCSSLYSVKTGTKAVEKAPSAVTLLKKFGILKEKYYKRDDEKEVVEEEEEVVEEQQEVVEEEEEVVEEQQETVEEEEVKENKVNLKEIVQRVLENNKKVMQKLKDS